jgi:hypothetical protein
MAPPCHYQRRVRPEVSRAPWVLRVTEHTDKPAPVFIVKERIHPDQRTDLPVRVRTQTGTEGLVACLPPQRGRQAPRSVLRESGLLYGPQLQRCLPVLRGIISRICDRKGIPLEPPRFLKDRRIAFRGNLPLDDDAGPKLALIFRLQERIKELDRVELIARRIERFTREEAAYWHSRISTFGDAANRWAMAGMKIMLAGQPRDPNVETILEELRQRY